MSTHIPKLLPRLANIARSSYLSVAKFPSDLLTNPQFICNPAKDVQFYHGKIDNTLIISFRGTDSFKDILININVDRELLNLDEVPYTRKGLVHQGFQESYRTVHDQIQDIISNHDGPTIFVGHSLGGAMSSIGALTSCLINPYLEVKCVTFGSPRVFNSTLAQTFNSSVDNSVRVVNSDDPIPMLPTRIRYRHVNGIIMLEHGKIINQPHCRFLRMIKNVVLTSERFMEDHAIKYYCQHIQKMIENKNE